MCWLFELNLYGLNFYLLLSYKQARDDTAQRMMCSIFSKYRLPPVWTVEDMSGRSEIYATVEQITLEKPLKGFSQDENYLFRILRIPALKHITTCGKQPHLQIWLKCKNVIQEVHLMEKVTHKVRNLGDVFYFRWWGILTSYQNISNWPLPLINMYRNMNVYLCMNVYLYG